MIGCEIMYKQQNANKQSPLDLDIEDLGIAENISFDQLLMRQISGIDKNAMNRGDMVGDWLMIGELNYRSAVEHLEVSIDPILDDDFQKEKKKIEKIRDKFVNMTKQELNRNIREFRKEKGNFGILGKYDKERWITRFMENVFSEFYTDLYRALIRLMDRQGLLLRKTGSINL